jgi:hypothetical protein
MCANWYGNYKKQFIGSWGHRWLWTTPYLAFYKAWYKYYQY